MSLATLNGIAATMARVQIPAWGVWFAEAELAREESLSGAVELKIADLTLTGTIIAGGAFAGRSRYHLQGGGGGWGRQLERRAYANDAGVKKRTVLLDAAAGAGEQLDEATLPAPSASLGGHWTRPLGPAKFVLDHLSPRAWHVGIDGVTRIGLRSPISVDTPAQRMTVDHDRAELELAAESIADLLPGAIVDGIEAVDVEHTVSAEHGLRTRLWGAPVQGDGAVHETIRQLVEAVLPALRYLGAHAYRVVTQEGERLNLQPVRVSRGMPDLRRVRVRPGVPGCRADVALGSTVLVVFVDGSPAEPVVIAFEDPESGGFSPTRLDLVGEDESTDALGAVGRAVRYGDPIVFGAPGPGTVTAPGAGSFSRVFP